MADPKLTVSVVMCTHNGIEFVEEQLASILNQTHVPDELIISDDDSSDGTLEFAIEYVNRRIQSEKKLSNLVLCTQKNVPALGVTPNFEAAISLSQSDLVALSDQDDIWTLNRLETVLAEFLAKPDLVLCHSDAELVNETNSSLNLGLLESLRASTREVKMINSGDALKVFLRRNLVTGATTIFKKSLYSEAFPFPEELLHDEWLGIVAASHGNRIKLISRPLIRYRQHSKNQVGASKLGFRHAIGRIFFPGLQRNQILLARAKAVADHPLFLKNELKESRDLIKDKLNHELVRSELPKSRLKRIPFILRELRTGRYTQFGLGVQDVVRDLLQPLT